MDAEPVLDAGGDDLPGGPPDLACHQSTSSKGTLTTEPTVIVHPVQELQPGQVQRFVEAGVEVLLGVIPVRREMRDSGTEVGADGIPAFTIVG